MSVCPDACGCVDVGIGINTRTRSHTHTQANQQHRYRDAIDVLSPILADDPVDDEANYNTAFSYEKSGKVVMAVHHYRQALSGRSAIRISGAFSIENLLLASHFFLQALQEYLF